MAPTIRMNDGRDLPPVGFGSFPWNDDDSEASTLDALAAGYRLVDTALRYGNEAAVGRAIAATDVPRDEIVVTTKLAGRHHGHDETITGFHESLAALALDHVDLYLIHWPLPRLDAYVASWRAMIELRDQGLIRSIGVSNFTEAHLTRLIDETGVVPAVNQVELHPYFPQAALREFHAAHGIVTESWSPLGRGDLLKEPAIAGIAEAHGVSPGQVVLRWHTQLGAVPIPASSNPSRRRENIDVFGFELTADEVAAISGLERGRIWDQDPDVHEEF
jgi:diketogulonate reductase-like aldo/keto reductase